MKAIHTVTICEVRKISEYPAAAHHGNDPKFSDRYAWANSADPDQTAPRGAV